MSNFKMIEKLGLSVLSENLAIPWVSANDLEVLLQSAQVVYGSFCKRQDGKNTSEWSYLKSEYDTHTALVIGVTSIKKQTKAEAALELLQEMVDDKNCDMDGTEHNFYIEAKRILEMKDEM